MAWFLLWIVQSLGVAALAALAGRLGARRVRPAVQHVVWLCALACVAALALVGLVPPGATTAAEGPAVAASVTASLAPLVIPAAPAWLSSVLLATWMIGTAWLGARVCWQLGRIRRLKRSCVVMAGRAFPQGRALKVASREGRRARFCWCDEAAGPSMLGFGRPIIAAPRRMADGLDDSDLERVLLHELAHVRRLDDWSALAEQCLVALMWVNPAVHLAIRGLAVSREMACDDWVIRRTAEPIAYARCLTAVAALRVHDDSGRLVAAVVGSRRVLMRRVARAIDERTRPSARVSQVAFALAPVLTGLVGVTLLALPPIVVEQRRPAGVPGRDSSVVSAPASRLVAARVPEPVANEVKTPGASRQQSRIFRPDGVVREAPLRVNQPADPTGLAEHTASAPASPDAARQPNGASTINETGGTESALPPPSNARAVGDLLMPAASGEHAPLLAADSDEPAWWSKASGAAGMIGGGVVSAGRATTSFAKLVGGALSSPFAR